MKNKNIYESKIVIVDGSKDITDSISLLLKLEKFNHINTFNKPENTLVF